MGFGDLKSDAGIKALDEFLADKSYIEGYVPSKADSVVVSALSSAPSSTYAHVLRWFKHISSYSASEQSSFPGQQKDINEYGPIRGNEQAKKDEDSDEDLFASDSEEENEEQERIKAERVAAYNAKKATKKVIIAKSTVLLDVKPWADDTDLAEMEKLVRGISMEGLVWGASKLNPIGYGIKKLTINCIIEDAKVSTEDLSEKIEAFENLVQSVDIAAFNKI